MTPTGSTGIVIVGGAEVAVDGLVAKIQLAQKRGVGPKLSVFATTQEPGETVDQALLRLCHEARAPWGFIRATTTEQLESCGFHLLDERAVWEALCHYHIGFRWPVEELEVEKYVEILGERLPNPLPADVRKGFGR